MLCYAIKRDKAKKGSTYAKVGKYRLIVVIVIRFLLLAPTLIIIIEFHLWIPICTAHITRQVSSTSQIFLQSLLQQLHKFSWYSLIILIYQNMEYLVTLKIMHTWIMRQIYSTQKRWIYNLHLRRWIIKRDHAAIIMQYQHTHWINSHFSSTNLPTYPAINPSFYNIILLHFSVTGLKIYFHFANKCF